MMLNNACYILTCASDGLEYLVAMLNSNAILWYSFCTNKNKTGVGDMQVGAQNINIIPIPQHPTEKEAIGRLVDSFVVNSDQIILEKIESLVCEAYGLSCEEQQYLAKFASEIYK